MSLLRRADRADSHRFLVPSLRAEDLTEHLQRAWVMLVCTEHLQAPLLRRCQLTVCQIQSRQVQERLGIGGR